MLLAVVLTDRILFACTVHTKSCCRDTENLGANLLFLLYIWTQRSPSSAFQTPRCPVRQSPRSSVCVQAAGLDGSQERGEIWPFQVYPIYRLEKGGIQRRPYWRRQETWEINTQSLGCFFHLSQQWNAFPRFLLWLVFKPKLSSLIARNENRTKPEIAVDIKQMLSSCYHPSSNQSKLQTLGILSHRVVNAGSSFLILPWPMLSISSEEDTVLLWDLPTEDKTFLLSLVLT